MPSWVAEEILSALEHIGDGRAAVWMSENLVTRGQDTIRAEAEGNAPAFCYRIVGTQRIGNSPLPLYNTPRCPLR